ncbi:MAG TPA: dihydrodipicolinate synthase family protein [Lentisphaeria bacterium]|nr:MAG: dihydrodipicolinate synthase family protein [Lentisphaerae bacterium GWF2_38_69]HBM15481.1 dihydrodipicolinate synthase family protein [Lentisphaeria bacterium]
MKIKGIIPPLITPLLSSDKLDTKGLDKLIEHVIKGGVHAIFILGTTGEAPSLSYRLRYELVERACKQIAGRLPVMVGITDTAFVESIKLANFAKENGADAVVLAPPYYFTAGPDELREYISDLMKEISVPLYLYNMPSMTKTMLDPETVKFASEIKGVKGIKDSSGNMTYFHMLKHKLKNNNDFAFYVGPEEILAESLFIGADGGVNGGANFCPEVYVNLFNAAQTGKWELAKELQNKILDISSAIYTVGKHGSSYLKGVKCALSLLGICSDTLAEPFHSFKNPEREKIKIRLKQLGLL